MYTLNTLPDMIIQFLGFQTAERIIEIALIEVRRENITFQQKCIITGLIYGGNIFDWDFNNLILEHYESL